MNVFQRNCYHRVWTVFAVIVGVYVYELPVLVVYIMHVVSSPASSKVS